MLQTIAEIKLTVPFLFVYVNYPPPAPVKRRHRYCGDPFADSLRFYEALIIDQSIILKGKVEEGISLRIRGRNNGS